MAKRSRTGGAMTLVEFLKWYSKGNLRQQKNEGRISWPGWVVKYGRSYVPAALPADIRPMPLGRCYYNAYLLAKRRQSRGYFYVEGWATNKNGDAMQHAWCADSLGGRVIDPTFPDPFGREYFGVAFRLESVEPVIKTVGAMIFHSPAPMRTMSKTELGTLILTPADCESEGKARRSAKAQPTGV